MSTTRRGGNPVPTPISHVHVAAGCIEDASGRILVCQRPAHKIYPGEWEFPGGKVERGETVAQALRRELREELGITVTASRPMIRLRHEYPELAVDLDVHRVTAFTGTVSSQEHPAIAWVAPDDLPGWKLLVADRPIVNALRLPPHYIFTPPSVAGLDLPGGLPEVPGCLLRLRTPPATAGEYRQWVRRHARRLGRGCHGLMVDRAASHVRQFGAAGFHATGTALRRLRKRPVARSRWFAASCHSVADLQRARLLGADFAVLGPVRATTTHPGVAPLGWPAFSRMVRWAGLPVYAIGGLGPADLETAWAHGAQGVAGISSYWPGY